MKPQRLERLIQLLRLLQAGHPYHKDALSIECGVSTRTVFRDLNILRAAGIPLIYDEKAQGYTVHGARLLPASHLTMDEVLALLFLGRKMIDQLPKPCFSTARQAILKLEGSLPLRLLEQVRGNSHILQSRGVQVNPQNDAETVYETLVQAKLHQRIVRISYRSPLEKDSFTTRLYPYGLLFVVRAWYVVGYSSLHKEVRTFHLSRIRNCQVLEETFNVPRTFSMKSYFGNAWRMIRCGEDQIVRLRFSSKVALNVAEVRWHETQQVHLRPDGRLDFEVTVAGLDEIVWWVLGYGSEVEVLEPDELRRMVEWHARKMVTMYRDRPSSSR
ncbi:MAG: WYL domain-containing transcriptional regulator [Planctomycetia bacterium]|nr:WYL domain-containing transcriptional regulator [Planctomycetia bacterium]